MAYMNQEKKTIIANLLKLVVPEGWKYSLAVQHHSGIVMTIYSAPIDLIDLVQDMEGEYVKRGYLNLNTYWLDKAYSGELLEVFNKIHAALNHNNHNRSDSQSDYFDVGHHVYIDIGKWDKPFKVTK